MVGTELYDVALYRSLAKMQRATNGLIAVNTRSLSELTPAEVHLETQWQRELEPVLTDLYWYPLRNGIDYVPDTGLKRWLRDQLSAAVAIAALLALLRRYLIRGVNVGGKMALDLLGLNGSFYLQNRQYVDDIYSHADTLTTVGTDLSLIDTTVDHLAGAIPAAKQGEGHPLLALGASIVGWAAVRSVNIAITEESRTVAQGLNWTYGENGIERQVFRAREDACPICSPLDGSVMPVNDVPGELSIPVHTRCRCWYEALTDGWTKPDKIWRGE